MSKSNEEDDLHANCLLCGNCNPLSLHLVFTIDENGEVTASFKGRQLLQGYRGMLHGGVIASLLDSAMTNCLFRHGINAVTGELKVRYRHPVPCSAVLFLRARIVSRNQPLYALRSDLEMDGKLMASASAKFMEFCR
ncbi:MAG: PaaI family thioesterase [Lentisphaerae bacterium]|nr:PaaI family thioesterase [Victivallaceae bacterium]MDD3117295.1 PaaI family thioesterase [Victivallaceae bacterium]MDD3704129.1 PaaI family thioesterase [Victivallaceae bacterium]MDD5664272.1 PaaI family thioesterase [Victivallaceae bacterium]NLK83843.1 PaaI family thioesterase [Lentisphaerota bacterium]